MGKIPIQATTSCSLGWRCRPFPLPCFCSSCYCSAFLSAKTSTPGVVPEARMCLYLQWRLPVFSCIFGQCSVWQRRRKGSLVVCRPMRSSLGPWSSRRLCLRFGSLLFGIQGDGWRKARRSFRLRLYRRTGWPPGKRHQLEILGEVEVEVEDDRHLNGFTCTSGSTKTGDPLIRCTEVISGVRTRSERPATSMAISSGTGR